MLLEIRDDRQMRAITGLSQGQFAQLLPVFEAVYEAKRQADYNKPCKTADARGDQAEDARAN